MMTSSNGKILRVTGPLFVELTGHRWILLTKTSDAELWSFLWSAPEERLSKESWGWWLETPSCSLWRHCNVLTSLWPRCSMIPPTVSDVLSVETFAPSVPANPMGWKNTSGLRRCSALWILKCDKNMILQWRHDERDDVSNHRGLDCFIIVGQSYTGSVFRCHWSSRFNTLRTKWLQIPWRHFKMHFLEWKYIDFD